MNEKNINIYVNPNWTYREAFFNIRSLKSQYDKVLATFSLWETKEWADFIRTTRNKFYSLNLLEWQIDNLWNCMNNNLPYAYLRRSALRYK